MHRRLAVPMLPLRVWVHCPRASNGLLPPRSYLVSYVRWYARSDSVLLFLLQTIIPTAFSSHTAVPTAIAKRGECLPVDSSEYFSFRRPSVRKHRKSWSDSCFLRYDCSL